MNKYVQNYITEVLLLINERVPMYPAKANFTLNDDGVLKLSIIVEYYWHDWNFDDDWEELNPNELVDRIISELKRNGVNIK